MITDTYVCVYVHVCIIMYVNVRECVYVMYTKWSHNSEWVCACECVCM